MQVNNIKEKFDSFSYAKQFLLTFSALLVLLAFIIVFSIVTQGWGLLISLGVGLVAVIAAVITEERN